jgi:chlorite dismutase
VSRALMRYAIYKLDPAWRLLPPEERSLHKKQLVDLLSGELPCAVHTYSTVGLRADADVLLWLVADGAPALQDVQTRMNATGLGRALHATQSYLAMQRPSMYLKGHKHADQEADLPAGPIGGTYLFVYPMDKVRAWYRLPFEDRRRIMGEHFKIGHAYPGVKIHTGYSFGIDDQEFVVAFEGESIEEFLELVQELRGSESSSYTARDVPIYTAVRTPIEVLVDQLDGGSP